MKLYVGNLSYNTDEETLKNCFSNYAEVASVEIMKDKFTGRSKGFGFVVIDDELQAERATGGMNGKDVDGRRIRVSEAVEKPRRDEAGFKRNYRNSGENGFNDRPSYRSERRSSYRRDEGRESYREERPYRSHSGRYGSGERQDSRRNDYSRSERFARREYRENPEEY